MPQKLAPFTAEDAARYVAQGALWLDSVLSDWAEPIDLNRLDIGLARECPLGVNAEALVPDYYAAMLRDSQPPGESELSLDYHDVLAGRNLSDRWAFEHGFSAVPQPLIYETITVEFIANQREMQTRFEMLRLAWITEIRKRQDATDDAFLDEIAGPRLVAV